MFMVVMNVRTAMISEATLSFMGIGLPIEVITWGSMLSLSDKALMTGSWSVSYTHLSKGKRVCRSAEVKETFTVYSG